jgi:hypothetical protein
MKIIMYWQNSMQLDKIPITWRRRARIWRTSKYKGIPYMQLFFLNANYWGLKAKKDTLSIDHSKL